MKSRSTYTSTILVLSPPKTPVRDARGWQKKYSMAKRGRPTKATRVAPPGTKYCANGDHFADLIDFVGKDSYCKECRKAYNKKYQESIPKPPRANVLGVSLRVYCVECDTLLNIMTTESDDSGKWVCPECGAEMEGSIRINLRGISLT